MGKGGRGNEKEIGAFLAGNMAPEPDGERKSADMVLFEERVGQLPVCREKKFRVRLWEQAAFVHPVSWGMQILFLVFGIWLAEWYDGEMAIMGISAMVPLFAVVGGFELSKAVFYHMWELERSCRYDTRKIAGMKMFLFGLCDLVVLTFFSLLIYGEGGDFMYICLLVLVPFNFSTGVYLFVMERFPIRNGNVLLLGMGCVMSGVQITCWSWWENSAAVIEVSGAGMVLLVSLVFLAGMAVRFCREKNREDEILWNLD